jgi:CheY-like chemotaxis protein
MPEMDGYQATAKLRSDARFKTLPIIAMTAHATIEERQRCLAAGMNDHISKPIDPALLIETVGRFFKPADAARLGSIPATSEPPKTDPVPDAVPSIDGLNSADGLARVAGNRKLYLKLLRQFAEKQGGVLEEITAALAGGDFELAERLAHTLKGVAGNIGAGNVQSAAGDLEKTLRTRSGTADVESAMQAVAAALEPLVAGLRAVLPAPAAEHAAPPEPVDANAAPPREAAAQLLKLLTEFDPGAADFIRANRASLRPLFPDDDGWARFTKLAEDYSFADAQALLEQGLAQFTNP